jgi:putative oxidoreductase
MNGSRNNPSSHRYLSYADGIAASWQDFLLLVARVLAGWIYLQSGWSKVWEVSRFAAGLTRRGVPELLGYAAPFVEFLGGLALVLGFATRYAALALILFTIAATWTSHIFWVFPEAERARQFTQFWKNVTMTGGLLAIFVAGPGRFSLDRWLSRRGR